MLSVEAKPASILYDNIARVRWDLSPIRFAEYKRALNALTRMTNSGTVRSTTDILRTRSQ